MSSVRPMQINKRIAADGTVTYHVRHRTGSASDGPISSRPMVSKVFTKYREATAYRGTILIERGYLRAATNTRIPIPSRIKGAIIERFGKKCTYCGKTGPSYYIGPDGRDWHIDHAIPRSRGGADHEDNYVLSCATCNLSKHAATPEEFADPKLRDKFFWENHIAKLRAARATTAQEK